MTIQREIAPPRPTAPPSASAPPIPDGEPDPPEDRAALDRLIHAWIGRFTLGLSPASLVAATMDWLVHLAVAPGKQLELAHKMVRKTVKLAAHAAARAGDPSHHQPPCIAPLPQDRRFADPQWQDWPFDLVYQSFLLTQQWWHNATTGIAGVSRHHEQVVAFAARQLLDVVSPGNFVATNPQVLAATRAQGGANLMRGMVNLLDDWQRVVAGAPPAGAEAFAVGRDLALTPGKVVWRNALIELIQYAPATERVHPEPILIVPAWIMKYYILDLQPASSLVRYLRDQGHTVFIISWKNPGPDDRDLGMDDYLRLGVGAALEAVQAIVPGRAVHTAGYCLGGTLLAIAVAALARRRPGAVASLTLLAAQTDFSEAGELTLFIDESQVTFLEDLMWQQGILDARQMAGAFQLLRSNDLIWSRLIHDYLMGERSPMSALAAWNADTTRMPFRMHSEYLRRLFLEDALSAGHYVHDGAPVALSDIRAPIFAVGTTWDHVAPWRSVYKINLQTDAEVTFVLTEGGHNAGIVSPPGGRARRYQITTRSADARYVGPEQWARTAPAVEGSWWEAWHAWLADRSGAPVAPPATGARGYPPIAEAPGSYVLER